MQIEGQNRPRCEMRRVSAVALGLTVRSAATGRSFFRVPAARASARDVLSGARRGDSMKQIRKILVPVDFSKDSRRALDEAIEWARAFGAELHLMHCYQFLPGTIENYGIEVHESFDHVRQAALRCLAEWYDKVRVEGIPVQ